LYDTEGIETDLPYNLAADNIQYEDFAGVCRGEKYNRLRTMKILAGFTGKTLVRLKTLLQVNPV
ncbi:hypothetical protein MTO96_045444, partial [Rhipicephalus appendiculatus]